MAKASPCWPLIWMKWKSIWKRKLVPYRKISKHFWSHLLDPIIFHFTFSVLNVSLYSFEFYEQIIGFLPVHIYSYIQKRIHFIIKNFDQIINPARTHCKSSDSGTSNVKMLICPYRFLFFFKHRSQQTYRME